MKQSDQLVLVPGQENQGKPVFQSPEDDEIFRRSFFDKVKESLDKWVEARKQSEEKAQRQWYKDRTASPSCD